MIIIDYIELVKTTKKKNLKLASLTASSEGAHGKLSVAWTVTESAFLSFLKPKPLLFKENMEKNNIEKCGNTL